MAFWNERTCEEVSPPSHLSLTTAIYSLVLALVTVPGNLLVCLAIYKDPFKELRSPFNYFILSLSAADLIVGAVTEPISVWIHFREWLSLPTEHIQLIHMSYFVSCTASLLSLAALSVERYIAITFPLQYRTKLNPKRAAIVSCVIWLTAISLPCVYLYVGYIKYAFVFANTAIVVTFAVLIFTSIRSFHTLKAQNKKWSKSRRISVLSNSSRQRKREERVTKVFLILLLVFIFCYTPSCVMIYVMNLCKNCSCLSIHWLRDLQFLFVLLSSSVNPFLYAWRLMNFRKAFVKLLSCSCVSINAITRMFENHSNAAAERETVRMASINREEDFDGSEMASVENCEREMEASLFN